MIQDVAEPAIDAAQGCRIETRQDVWVSKAQDIIFRRLSIEYFPDLGFGVFLYSRRVLPAK